MAIPESLATSANLLASTAWWLHGTFYDVDPTTCALAQVRQTTLYGPVDVLLPWSEMFPGAPEPIVRGVAHQAEVDGNDRLREGSPIMLLGLPLASPIVRSVGSMAGQQEWTLALTLRAAVWKDSAVGRLDTMATTLQLLEARDRMMALLSYRDGVMPLWDRQDLGAYGPSGQSLGNVQLKLRGQPVVRENAWQADFNVAATMWVEPTRVAELG